MNPYHKPPGFHKPIKSSTPLHELSVGNRFRLMFGLKQLPENKMNRRTHVEMVASLAKNPADIIASLTMHKCHTLHMIDGIGDEYFELEEEIHNFNRYADEMEARGSSPCNKRCIKELGDLLFYTEGMRVNMYDGFADGMNVCLAKERIAMAPITTMKNVFEFTKRYIFYNQPPNIEQWAQAYMNLIAYIEMCADMIGSSLDEVRQQNYDKLAGKGGRHEGGYSDQKAVDRVDTKVTPDPLGADQINKDYGDHVNPCDGDYAP